TKAHVQPFSLGVPAHGDPGASAVGKFGTGQRRGPLLRFDTGNPLQLLSEHALFQGKLFAMGQMLHAASATATEVRTWRGTPQGTGLEYTFGAGLHNFAMGIEYPSFDF